MKTTAKVLALIMALLLSAGMLAACSGTAQPTAASTTAQASATADAAQTAAASATATADIDPMAKYDPGITLTLAGTEANPNEGYPEGVTMDNNPWKTAYKDILGITFENKWTVPADKYTEKLNTQIAAGDIPDILNGLGAAQYEQLKKLGLATPLEDYIDKYATDLCKQGLNSDDGYSLLFCKGSDGHTYALPHVYGYTDNVCEMWIRSDWLKKLNLQAPKTMDEFYAMLKAFAAADFDGNGKADSLGIITPNDLWAINSIFNSFGSQPFWSWYKDDTGTLRYSTVYKPDATKKALEFLAKLYKEGLMDQEFGTENYDKYNEYLASGKAGVSFMPWWYADTFANTVNNDPNADWDAYPIPNGMGDGAVAKPFAYYGPAAYNVVSIKCQHPEAAVKLLNIYVDKVYGPGADKNFSSYVRADNGYNMTWLSVVGLTWANKMDTFANVAAAVEKKDASSLNAEEKTYYDSCIKYLNGDKTQWAAYKKYGPGNATISVIKYYNDTAKPLFSNFYGPNTDAVKQYQSSLDAKWLSTCVEIIMGQKPVTAYDDFVKEWYSLGGDKMEKEVNDYAKAHPDMVK